MNRHFPPLLAAAAVLLTSGCALLPGSKKTRKPTVTPSPQLVGIVTLVNTEGRFVLIDCEGRPSPAPGTTLLSAMGVNPPWELRVSEIRRRPFVVADFEKGTPGKGDRAFSPPAPPPSTPP